MYVYARKYLFNVNCITYDVYSTTYRELLDIKCKTVNLIELFNALLFF